MTLHFYSPKAYEYVRNKFNKSLPHPVTISKWYQTINGEPGFTIESLEALKIKVKEAEKKNCKIICNIVIDEVAIRQQVEWDGKKYYGFVNCGASVSTDTISEAKEALVIMLVGVNTHWKIPIGYFLINGLNGQEKANIILRALEFIGESAVVVSSLTFDGAPSNFSMAKCLGADFSDYSNLKTYFISPITKEKIFIILDPSHMIKLIRNCFGEYSILECEGKQISWSYLKNLVEIQLTEGLTAATKLKQRHLSYHKEKMRVKLATQTVSKSVATALAYLRDDIGRIDNNIYQMFRGSEETEKFLLIFNDCFDILNSSSKYATYIYKRGLSPHNEENILRRLEEIKTYIKKIEYAGNCILSSGRKCGFLGLLIGIESLKGIYGAYVTNKQPLLKYILTYKFSQDHLEIFFSAIRTRGGHNNNPTSKQFESSYKKLLCHIEVKDADTGNAIAIDNTSILHCSSSSKKPTVNANGDDLLHDPRYLKFATEIKNMDFISSPAWHLTTYSGDVVKYIAGFVKISLRKCVSCSKCIDLLESDAQESFLQMRKTFLGAEMNIASQFVTDICISAEKCFRCIHNKINIYNINKDLIGILTSATLRHLPTNVFDYFSDHLLDLEPLSDHFINLIKLVLRKYFDIRIYHETKKRLDSNVGVRVRSMLTKTITFKHQ